jgi:uncharacterized iron-regulated protein
VLIILLLIPSQLYAQEYPAYNLSVSFDIAGSAITGLSRIDARAGRELVINRGSLEIHHIRVDGKKSDYNNDLSIIRLRPEQDGVVEISFEGVFRDVAPSGENYGVAGSVISERGISLTGIWYPIVDGLAYYSLKASLPAGYEAVSEAESAQKTVKRESTEFLFSFPHPLDGINFVASNRYEVISDTYNDMDIYAFFFRDDLDIARTYIEFTKKYMEMYGRLLGAYPYKRFSIVENFLPTGYSMPTYTLLGSSVVNLPFIVETSLGHEILHQWFGNSVYIDYAQGNWAEGLTTYLSDHLYKEQKNEGWEYRKRILSDYRSYVTTENDFPLKDFRSRVDFSSRAIGYGKTAMVFHMLKRMVGEDNFFKALKSFVQEKRYTPASWEDIRISFERMYDDDLEWFFSQWVEGSGMPAFDLYGFEVTRSGSGYELHFHLDQNERVFQFSLPVTIYSGAEVMQHMLEVHDRSHGFNILLPHNPGKVVFDENYDVARMIDDSEFPPVISRLIDNENLLLILPQGRKGVYDTVIERFRAKGADIRNAEDVADEDIRSSSMLILDIDNPVIGRLYGRVSCEKAGFCVLVKENPWNSQEVAGIMSGTSRSEVDAAFRKVFHYGKYSKLLFEDGRNTEKEIAATQRGVSMDLKEETPAVDISGIKTLADVIKGVADKKIIYVGEVHDVFAHHAVQLDIIEGIHKLKKRIAIGMEMFQTPFQQSLDRFIDGKMGEREFLKESEYFKRWGFDYNLYKPILDFARAEKVPVIALNTRREIIDSVSHGGIDSLSEEQREDIPSGMDFSDKEYRARLEEVFSMHAQSEERNFDYFYQSQILWDETMAESTARFLESHPEYSIVVLAGQGHLIYGSGIPKRAFRRNGHEYATVLIDASVEKDIADYVVFPKPVEGVTSPKLMVFLQKEEEGFKITGFPDESVSEKAGLMEGDIVLYVEGVKVESIDDIKIQLLYKRRGEIIKVRVMREEKGRDEEVEVEVEL